MYTRLCEFWQAPNMSHFSCVVIHDHGYKLISIISCMGHWLIVDCSKYLFPTFPPPASCHFVACHVLDVGSQNWLIADC